MKVRETIARAALGIVVAFVTAAPGGADPAPSASPVASPDASPVASPAASPVANTSDAALPAPGPEPSGSYKEDLKMAALATSLLLQAQSGDVDRSMLESKMNMALSPTLVQTVSAQLAPLGKPKSVTLVSRSVHGDFVAYKFRIAWDGVAADESFALNPDGKIVAWGFQPAT